VRDVKMVLGLLLTALRVVFWTFGTVWLGGQTLWRSAVLLSRWRQISAEVRFCPRGHEVPAYGLWDCACGSRIEGWAFTRCEICHETAAYVPCPVCGLPVKNPFLL
jgi:hypothetical protein